MKKALLLAALSLVVNVCCAADDYEDWMPRLKEIFATDKPYVPVENKELVRETKFPGETYWHFFDSNTTGLGREIQKKTLWFDTSNTIRFHHTVNVILREEIKSSQAKLDDGIIISEFTVEKFQECLGNVTGESDFGFIGSAKLARTLMKIGNSYGNELKIVGTGFITAGVGVAKAPVPEVYSKIGAAGSIALGGTLYGIGWFTRDYLPGTVTEDGYKKLDPDHVKKAYPAYKTIVEKIQHIEGSKVIARWEAGIGYTEIKIKPAAHNISKEDCEMLAKMIYRMNPIGARSVFPKEGDKKTFLTVNAKDICGVVLLPAGVDYNTLSGSITFRNKGKKSERYPDETEIKGDKATPIRTLTIADDFGCRIAFRKKFDDGSNLTFTVTPKGKFEVATDEDGNDDAPIYVRHVEIEGALNGQLDKSKSGFWSRMEVEESSLQLKCEYNQLRQGPKRQAAKPAK